MLKRFKWRNIKISTKNGLVMLITILLFVLSTGIVSLFLNDVNNSISALERRGDRSIDLTQMGSLIRTKDIRIADYINFKNDELITEYQERGEKFDRLVETIRPEMDTEDQKRLFDQIVTNDKTMNDLFIEEIVPAVSAGEFNTVNSLRLEASNLRSRTVNLLQNLRPMVNNERALAVSTAKEDAQRSLYVLFAAIGGSILIGGLLTYFINRSIRKNLKKVVAMSQDVADGNLNVETLDYKGNDEIGQLSSAFNEMLTSLRTMIQQITDIAQNVQGKSNTLNHSATEVRSGAEQIASTMEQLSSGTEEQASSASNISDHIQTLNQQIRQSTQESEELSGTSKNVYEQANQGKEQMNHSVEQMNEINTIVTDATEKVQGLDRQSQEISKLVDVIQDISEQTNLLALNAAIEAARAGEAGKGFAVVADEVRKLAEQVGRSVDEITGIIQGIQKESGSVVESLQNGYHKVEEGNQQIHTSRDAFVTINQSVAEIMERIQNVTGNLKDVSANSEKVSQAGSEIAASSEESAAGVEQSSSTAQQQSSSMQEISSSADDLAAQAEELNKLVQRFNL